MSFKKYMKQLAEETCVSDIAGVETKLDLVQRHKKHQDKGKKCKSHKNINCEICKEEKYN